MRAQPNRRHAAGDGPHPDRDHTQTRPILARHAAEFAGGFVVAAIVTAVLCAAFVAIVALHAVNPSITPGFLVEGGEASPNTAQSAQLFALGTHALFTVLAAVSLGPFLHGSGVRTNSLTANHPSIYYTLTLPVSRARLVLWRYLFAAAGAAVLLGFMLLANSLVLLVAGYAVPLTAMSRLTAMGVLFLGAVTAVIGFLTILGDNVASGLMALGGIALIVAMISFGWDATYIVGRALDPVTAAALLAVAAVSLIATVHGAKRRDF